MSFGDNDACGPPHDHRAKRERRNPLGKGNRPPHVALMVRCSRRVGCRCHTKHGHNSPFPDPLSLALSAVARSSAPPDFICNPEDYIGFFEKNSAEEYLVEMARKNWRPALDPDSRRHMPAALHIHMSRLVQHTLDILALPARCVAECGWVFNLTGADLMKLRSMACEANTRCPP
ncbi:MAG: hypothetical protein ACREWG_05855 [Gammaproteobacteria bacterium]